MARAFHIVYEYSGKETASPSTTLRFGRDDNWFVG
jgi:hypothetical protein